MEFHAFHGCFKEEQITGNSFVVDIFMETDTSKAEYSDNLEETINYADVYELIRKEMAIKAKLIEHVGRRIIDVVLKAYPQIAFVEVKVAKLNPPVGGRVHSVCVTLDNLGDE